MWVYRKAKGGCGTLPYLTYLGQHESTEHFRFLRKYRELCGEHI